MFVTGDTENKAYVICSYVTCLCPFKTRIPSYNCTVVNVINTEAKYVLIERSGNNVFTYNTK